MGKKENCRAERNAQGTYGRVVGAKQGDGATARKDGANGKEDKSLLSFWEGTEI